MLWLKLIHVIKTGPRPKAAVMILSWIYLTMIPYHDQKDHIFLRSINNFEPIQKKKIT